ncbi:MAG: PAS domain-containing protein [Rufibacter sp.]
MELMAFEEAQKIWRKISKESTLSELKLELEFHKKLLNIFQVGDYYYYLFNCLEAKIEYVQENVTSVLGLSPEEFTVPNILDLIHPDDLPWFLTFENAVTEFFAQLPPDKIMKYKVRYDYRIKKADGEYLRILQQVVTVQTNEIGAVLRTLGVHTDISHLKTEGKPVLSFIGLEGEPSYIDVKTNSPQRKNS